MKAKLLSIILSLCMIFAIMPITAFATDVTTLDISQGDINITTDGTYIITQSIPNIARNSIKVSATSASITIKNLNIAMREEAAAFSIAANSSVELTISGNNTLKGNAGYAGLWVPEGASVTIQSTNGGTTDSLTATGGNYGAGIGGSNKDTTSTEGAICGTVNIKSGKIIANGGTGAAGIGGGCKGIGGDINISAKESGSTTVTATGGNAGAGIGGGSRSKGFGGDGGNITISAETSGTATVTATGGNDGAGIGGGNAGKAGNITISAETGGFIKVEAYGGEDGAGIGGGESGNGGNITISSKKDSSTVITAAADTYGSGIGSGDGGKTDKITISAEEGGSTSINSTGGEDGGTAIGGGDSGECGIIEITGSTVIAEGYYVGIGNNTDSIVISDSTITAFGGIAMSAYKVDFDYTDGYKWRTSDTANFTFSDVQTYTSSSNDNYLDVAPGIAITGIELDESTLALNVGDTDTLTATITPDNATNKAITWSSSDTSVATVENGEITAIGVGEAIITATTANGTTATCVVTVTVPVTGVELDETVLELNVNDTATLTATITPDNATNKTIIWTTSDESVATVDENGVVIAISAGVATITATADNGTSADCEVTVSEETGGVLGFLRMIKMLLELIIYIMGVFA